MKRAKRLQRFLSIFLACIMMFQTPMSVMASELDVIVDLSEQMQEIQEETAVQDELVIEEIEEEAGQSDSGGLTDVSEAVETEEIVETTEISTESSTEESELFETTEAAEETEEQEIQITVDSEEVTLLKLNEEASGINDNKLYQPIIVKDLHDVEYTLPKVEAAEFYLNLQNANKDIYGRKVENLTVSWYKNTAKSYDGAVLFEAGKDGALSQSEDCSSLFCKPNVTSILGTTYYFCKLTATLSDESVETFYSGIGSITINAPVEMDFGIITGEDAIGQIYIKAEDTVPLRSDLVDRYGNPVEDLEPLGIIFDYTVNGKGIYVYPSDTMTTVIARTCMIADVEIGISGSVGSGMGSYIYTLAGREEFDRGAQSGWMGSLNGWYTNTGFDNYKISDGTLQPNDYISLKYTTDLGKDIGAAYGGSENTKKLKALTIEPIVNGIVWSSIDFLNGEFDPEVTEYDVAFAGKWTGLQITPVAENENNKVQVKVSGKECRGKHQTAITKKTTIITISIEDPNIEGGDTEPLTYTIRVHKDPTLMLNTSVELTETAVNGKEYTTTANYISESNSGLGSLFSANLQSDTEVEAYRINALTVNLKNLPSNVTASIKYKGKTWQAVDGKVTINEYLPFVGTRTYTIALKDTSGTEECYYLQLNKKDLRLNQFNVKPKLASSDAVYTEIFNGEKEGTWFQLDTNGTETGKTGFAPSVTDYKIYIGSFVDGFYLGATSIGLENDSNCISLSANGKVIADTNDKRYTWGLFCGTFLKNGNVNIPLTEGDNTIVLKLYEPNAKDTNSRTYTLHVYKKNVTALELQEKILSLPKPEDLSYSKDRGTVEMLQQLFDNLTETQKSEVSAEAVEKLNQAVARIAELYQYGQEAITELRTLVNTYAGKVTETNYVSYEETVAESQTKLNQMTDWIYAAFVSECAAEYKAMNEAADIIKKGKILKNETLGEATDYIDDFMVSANAFNLSLETYEKDHKAYPVNFKDYIVSNMRNQEACLPYNTPGRLKIEIADSSIFKIESEIVTYEDKGLGGGNAGYDNELYYMVPLKAGTTTFTVTLTDQTGHYYGQTPKMIVHVNSAGEASIEKLEDKLTNINSLPYTRKYDTWYYWKGTEGAKFSFHVNGLNAKVSVWDYNGTGKTEYPVDANGDVTVLLKDGYNPIEVTAEYEGKTVTQVYGLRAKVLSYVLTNESRPGLPLKVGDQATLKLIGITTPVYKILRIYNPSQAQVYFDTDMSYQSQIVGTGTQYSIGAITFTVTSSGTQSLTNGRIYQRWWGEPLYSETAQGNTGELATQSEHYFSRIPDITFTVEENPTYEPDLLVHPTVNSGSTANPGDTVTISLADMDLNEITQNYPLDTNNYYTKLKSAQTIFVTDIPGAEQISSTEYDRNKQNSLSTIKTVKFTIPENTPEGTYHIKGGYVVVMYGMESYGIFKTNMFQLQIDDVEITVKHRCVPGTWSITKEATCIENGIKSSSCSICKEPMTETIPKTGHAAGEWLTTKEATCTETGTKVKKCKHCEMILSTETLQKTDHISSAWILAKEATCTAAGTRVQKCMTCGITIRTKEIAKTGHSYGVWTTVSEATVKAPEMQKHTCSTCGNSETQEVGSKLNAVLELPAKLASISIKKGNSKTFTVTMASGDSVVSVKSSAPKTLKVTLDQKTGKITLKALKTGTAKLTIKLDSKTSKTYTVKVVTGTVKTTGVSVTSIKNKKLTLKAGKTHTLKTEVKPFTTTQKLTYKSSDKKVATVTSKGKIEAVAPGKATITVKSGSKSVKITVTVPGITIAKSSVTVKKNKTTILKPNAYGISGKITYTSSNPKVATVTSKGKVKGIKKGSAKITIKAGTYTKTVTVKVK